jgi:hypothetical protein
MSGPIEIELEDDSMGLVAHRTIPGDAGTCRTVGGAMTHQHRMAELLEEIAIERLVSQRHIEDEAFGLVHNGLLSLPGWPPGPGSRQGRKAGLCCEKTPYS